MQTDPEFRVQETPQPIRTCDFCGTHFVPRQDDHRFHSDDCRSKWNNEKSARSRSAMRHLRQHLVDFSRRGLLGMLLPSIIVAPSIEQYLQGSPRKRRPDIYAALCEADDLLLKVGPGDQRLRHEIRTQAQVILAVIGPTPEHPDDQTFLVRACELLRDIGIEAPFTEERIAEWLWVSKISVEFFRAKSDHDSLKNLARVLICRANMFRFLERQVSSSQTASHCRRLAKSHFTWAANILRSLGRDDPETAQLLHQIEFRSLGPDQGLGRRAGDIAHFVDQKINLLESFAADANRAQTWIEHYREVSGLVSYRLGDHGRAAEYLAQMKRYQASLDHFTNYAEPTLLTPKIASLFESGERGDAIRAIGDEYFPLYRENRHAHYYAQLLQWERKHRFDLKFELDLDSLPQPEYGSGFVAYFNRYDPERSK